MAEIEGTLGDVEVRLPVPEEILTALNLSPEMFANELRGLAAVKLYEMGRLSSELAAELAGLSREEFFELLPRYGVSAVELEGAGLASP
jgi:predicted HTH domain antitoxin